jgi:hypothetical protein
MGIRRTPGSAKEVTRQEKRLREEKDFLEWEYFLFYRDEIEFLFTINRVFCWGVICREAGAFLLTRVTRLTACWNIDVAEISVLMRRRNMSTIT